MFQYAMAYRVLGGLHVDAAISQHGLGLAATKLMIESTIDLQFSNVLAKFPAYDDLGFNVVLK